MWMSFFEIFGNKKCICRAKKLTERWYLLITEKFLFWTFRWWEIWSFLSQEVDGKDDIYWLRKSSCFELFGGGKYGLFLSQEVDGKMIFAGYREVLVLNFSVMGNTIFFSAKKLMQRWYLLGFFELLMIFQDLRNTVFCAASKLHLQSICLCIYLYSGFIAAIW